MGWGGIGWWATRESRQKVICDKCMKSKEMGGAQPHRSITVILSLIKKESLVLKAIQTQSESWFHRRGI